MITHVIPVNDKYEHNNNDSTCDCGPRVVTDDGNLIIIHRAYDYREFKEEPQKLFGFYEIAGQEKPAFDPGIEGIPCLFCWEEISHPVKTISFMKYGSNKSYFYRCHKACYEKMNQWELEAYESPLIDKA